MCLGAVVVVVPVAVAVYTVDGPGLTDACASASGAVSDWLRSEHSGRVGLC